VGWRLVFTAPQYFNWGWSVSPWSVRRRFERAFEEAVECTLREMHGIMEGRWDSTSMGKHCLSAVFRSNAAIDYSPQLQATILFFNFALQRDGTTVSFTTERVIRLETNLKSSFHNHLVKRMERHKELLSPYDRWYYGRLLEFLFPLEPAYRTCACHREHWSGRNHEGTRSELVPFCFPDWKSKIELFAQHSHDTDLHPEGNPPHSIEKLIQNYCRAQHREKVLKQKETTKSTATDKSQKQELEIGW
jgi:hypothetical protein